MRRLVPPLVLLLLAGAVRAQDPAEEGTVRILREGDRLVNPLPSMSPEELSAVGSVVLGAEGPEVTESLSSLDLARCALRDLAPIAKLPSIEEVDASFSRVRALPAEKVPGLRVLRLAGAEVPDEAVAAFRRPRGGSTCSAASGARSCGGGSGTGGTSPRRRSGGCTR